MIEMKRLTINDITFDVVDDGATRFDKAQALTKEQQAQARENIGINDYTTQNFEDGDIIPADTADADIQSVMLYGKTITTERASKNLCSAGTVTFTREVYVDIEEIPPGTYLTSALITSSDTDTEKCPLMYYNGSTMIISQNFERNVRASNYYFTTEQPINRLRFYAAEGWNEGANDTCTWADIQIEDATGLNHFQVTEFEPYGTVTIENGISPSVSIGGVELSADTEKLFTGDTLEFVTGKVYRADTGDTQDISVSGSVENLFGDLVIKTPNITKVTYKKNAESTGVNEAMKWLGNKIRYFGIAAACGAGLSQCAEAITQCAHCGMDGIEVDVRLAADGTVMIMHSEDISGTVNAEAGTLVSSKTLSELKAYKFLNDWIQYGYYEDVRMITLDECIQLCKKYGLLLTIDLKSDGYEETNQTLLLDNIIAVCMKHGVQDSVVYTSLLSESRKYIRSKLPNAHIAVKKEIANTTFEDDLADLMEIGGNVLMQVEGDPSEDILTPERLTQYHRYGAPVKDRDYIFTYDKPGLNKSGISYLFQFTTADSGTTWTVDTTKSSPEASATTTLTLANGVYSFVNYCLPPFLLQRCAPAVSVTDDKIGQYAVTIQDYAGIKFKRISGDTPTKITIRLDF